LDGADVKYDGCIDRVPFRLTELLLVGKRKRRKRRMNKRYLPVIAAFLIAVTCTTFLPAIAQLPTYVYAAPTLYVKTIAQDDQERHIGVMWQAPSFTDFVAYAAAPAGTLPEAQDLLAQFKILVSYNGVPVTPSSVYCQLVEKDKYNPIKTSQGSWENLETVVFDKSNLFVCKFRWGKPGVGVLDVYFIGAPAAIDIADFILVVGVNYAVGRSTVYGTEIQDICLLGWPAGGPAPDYVFTKPDGTEHWVYADPLAGWSSCDDLALAQKAALGIPVPWE
jgi:hypothetical protein